jgi:hypothetical protein
VVSRARARTSRSTAEGRYPLPHLPHVTEHTGFKGVGYVPGVTEYSGFKGVGYVPGVKKWRPRDWRQGIERTIAPLPRSRVPFVPQEKKVTK